MIFDTQTLKLKYNDYVNISQKINIEEKNGNLTRIKRGLYTDNFKVDSPIIANISYGESYLSYEYALSYYGLIPEFVSVFTSACFAKKNNRIFLVNDVLFEYKSIPNNAFPYGITYLFNEEGIRYKIATKEKALCDMLYSRYPVRTLKDMNLLLFSDLRIDKEEFMKLDFNFILSIASNYHSNSINTLCKLIKEVIKDAINNRTNN